mmetsp:Transcript_17838/g.33786  ORF Transcript_17838/g.33786 Transcript_17838/m.33786 type:complete len:329 (-) Transcript_17838:266-1252(-)
MGGTGSSPRGRVAVITGGASGIGFGVAKKCAQLGMKICIADVNDKMLSKATNALLSLGAQHVMAYRCDVSKLLSVWDFKDKVYAEYGEVAFLFNNAGLSAGWSSYGSTKSEWDLALGVNLNGVINGISAFVPSMIAQNTPCCVINTSSVAGLVGANSFPFTGAPYVVAKTAVTALTECLGVELRERKTKVTAHVLMPGMVKTGIMKNSEETTKKLGNSKTSLTEYDLKNMASYKEDFETKSLSVEELVQSMYARLCRGDFYLIITPPFQPEAVFRAIPAVRADDIVNNRPVNSISLKPLPRGTRKAFKKNVKEAAKTAAAAMQLASKL